MKEENLAQILYSLENLPDTKETDIEKQIEFIILYNRTVKKLKEIASEYNDSIKEYYSGQNLTKKELNDLIFIEETMNLDFVWNKEYNFSCRLIKLSTQEKLFVICKNQLDFFIELDKLIKEYKGIKIVDFRCRNNRESYVKIINTINLLSQLRFNNIKLK